MKQNNIKWGKIDIVSLVIILIPIFIVFFTYNKLPEQMASHFGTNGEVDGYQKKFTFILTMLALLVGAPLLMKIVRYIDPKKKNYDKFESIYDWFRLIFTVFLSAVMVVTILFNLGYPIKMQMVVLLGVGILFIFLGNFMSRIQFNYTMGIKTPWTLASEEVWRRTHRLGGPMWFIAGILFIILAFIPGKAAFSIMMGIIAVVVLVPIIYSYFLYKKIG